MPTSEPSRQERLSPALFGDPRAGQAYADDASAIDAHLDARFANRPVQSAGGGEARIISAALDTHHRLLDDPSSLGEFTLGPVQQAPRRPYLRGIDQLGVGVLGHRRVHAAGRWRGRVKGAEQHGTPMVVGRIGAAGRAATLGNKERPTVPKSSRALVEPSWLKK